MNVLVTGGAGYIGSHAVRRLLAAGHRVVVVDDLSRGYKNAVTAAGTGLNAQAEFIQTSTSETNTLIKALREYAIEAVMHFAAFSEVGESVTDPGKYYRNNLANVLAMMDALRLANVRKLVFSSTAAVYGNPETTPITEEHPVAPINPYGRSKMMVEKAIKDYAAAYGLGYVILRYFNVAGASPDGVIGEAHQPESHLIPRLLAAASAPTEAISIYGTDYPTRDGTCIRDYIHVDDVVSAHLMAMEKIELGVGSVYNLGSERGFTVREVIAACSKIVGWGIPTKEAPRRPGDPAVLVASSAKIRRDLGWVPRYSDLRIIVEHAWNWHQRHPHGYLQLSTSELVNLGEDSLEIGDADAVSSEAMVTPDRMARESP